MTKIFKPILFSTEMVQAILAGRKQQTRRVIKIQPQENNDVIPFLKPDWDGKTDFPLTLFYFDCDTEKKHANYEYQLPLCQPEDILWVRETFCPFGEDFIYKANPLAADLDVKWKPSLFMPKKAARIFLKVTNVRCERLQDISEEDAIAEGIRIVGDFKGKDLYHNYKFSKGYHTCPKLSFCTLWDSINAKKHPWDSNPWVWVYDFEQIEKPENFLS